MSFSVSDCTSSNSGPLGVSTVVSPTFSNERLFFRDFTGDTIIVPVPAPAITVFTVL